MTRIRSNQNNNNPTYPDLAPQLDKAHAKLAIAIAALTSSNAKWTEATLADIALI